MRWLLIALTGLSIPLSFIDAPFPDELVLQHIPTLVALVSLAVAMRFGLSPLSFGCLIVFLWLHVLGARWIYSYVPYDRWASALTGSSLSEQFDWDRNHYDRLVHFASGLLGVPPASEVLQRSCGMRPLGGAIVGVACILAVGAMYEILEWQIAVFASPAQAEAYNGQQGDIWDPQKDMALAWFGGMISAGLVFRWSPLGRGQRSAAWRGESSGD
ncbi:DUF2238 domain-containing protein [Roseiconus nitratireducens]|uniref:DUF2238 domain-containing protein n=1 Tax=Roseiconus nitratireducens TaxID=2605748 RepID=A0A5M6DIL9_9BACT|nr:DUF2238 domain-containing protein [Roseiconus nitratireducens]